MVSTCTILRLGREHLWEIRESFFAREIKTLLLSAVHADSSNYTPGFNYDVSVSTLFSVPACMWSLLASRQQVPSQEQQFTTVLSAMENYDLIFPLVK